MEAGMSFGWTFCLVPKYPHFWLFFGPGYAGSGLNLPKDDVALIADDLDVDHSGDTDNYNFYWHNSFAPEAGVLVKIGPAVLRYTFQYRLAFDDMSKDFFEDNKTRHMFGVGFCF